MPSENAVIFLWTVGSLSACVWYVAEHPHEFGALTFEDRAQMALYKENGGSSPVFAGKVVEGSGVLVW